METYEIFTEYFSIIVQANSAVDALLSICDKEWKVDGEKVIGVVNTKQSIYIELLSRFPCNN